ncbi:hypothetical protein JCM8097_007510 [Rhodosporidiobolus ruineniae]
MASATSSSASTSNSTGPRTDEEDNHGEDGAEEIKASRPRRLSLLDLPDELLVQVFEQSVLMEHSWHLPYSQTTTLSCLSNLVSLSISFGCADGDIDYIDSIPEGFTDALKSFHSLRSWRIESYPSLDDEGFSLDRDVPSLRRLDTGSVAVLSVLFENGATVLSSLVLSAVEINDLEGIAIPWRTLRAITFDLDDGGAGRGKVLVEPLELAVKAAKLTILAFVMEQDASHTMLPIEELSFNFDIFRPSTPGNSPFFAREHLSAVLNHLQLSRLRLLSLSNLTRIDWASCGFTVRSVREVRLEGTCRLTEPKNLRSLHAFITMFPSLTTLTLRGFAFSSSAPDAYCPLVILRTTSVLEFRFSAANEEQEMRWTRTSRDEDFVGERWQLV